MNFLSPRKRECFFLVLVKRLVRLKLGKWKADHNSFTAVFRIWSWTRDRDPIILNFEDVRVLLDDDIHQGSG